MVAAGPFNQFKIVSDQSNIVSFRLDFLKEQISSMIFDTNDTINIKMICLVQKLFIFFYGLQYEHITKIFPIRL